MLANDEIERGRQTDDIVRNVCDCFINNLRWWHEIAVGKTLWQSAEPLIEIGKRLERHRIGADKQFVQRTRATVRERVYCRNVRLEIGDNVIDAFQLRIILREYGKLVSSQFIAVNLTA